MDFTNRAVYLSGAMTGYPDFNEPTFNHWEMYCYAYGAKYVHNPAKGATNVEDAREHEYYMLADIHELTQSEDGKPIYDVMALIPGWGGSRGVIAEIVVANACGIEIVQL